MSRPTMCTVAIHAAGAVVASDLVDALGNGSFALLQVFLSRQPTSLRWQQSWQWAVAVGQLPQH